MWSLALALHVRDHVLVFACSWSVVVSQGTSGVVAAIVSDVIMRPDAPYGMTAVEMLDDDDPGEGGGRPQVEAGAEAGTAAENAIGLA